MEDPAPTDNTLCFVVTCRGRLSFLKQSLPSMMQQPGCCCVVVDYSCPDRCGEWVEANYPRATVVRVEGRPRFNHNDARSRGVAAVTAPWLCLIDSDIVLAPGFAQAVLPTLRPGAYYRADPWTDHTFGTYILPLDDYKRVGGHDPVIEGYGSAETDLFARLKAVGIVPSTFPGELIEHIDHSDEQRTEHYTIKDMMLNHTVNRIYSVAKMDFWRLTGKYPDLATRQRFYEVFNRETLAAVNENKPRLVHLELSQATLLAGHDLQRMMLYQVIPKDSAEAGEMA